MANTIFTSVAHGYIDGQYVYINDTTNYDGRYQINVIDENTFEAIDCVYVADETSGTSVPDMNYDFYIAFLFGIEAIFDEIKLKTALRAKNVKDGNGKILMEEIAMTEDRRDIFMYFLKEAADRCYQVIHAYSKGITNAFQFNIQIDLDADGTIETEDQLNYIQMVIKEDKTNQDENMYTQLDSKITQYLVAEVMKEWYLTTPLGEESLFHEERANRLLREVNNIMMDSEGVKRVQFNQGVR